eukprot:TRINITY_DN9485_c0_g1_i1.p1 TRINITY_DN9485_c0_g1~~TRINITY_DN9485_c0_g1_i1.p1  ORF type:complete len:142 (+),score=18.61 TRINITY_DN9485_c0_g1_i1:96-521(+)
MLKSFFGSRIFSFAQTHKKPQLVANKTTSKFRENVKKDMERGNLWEFRQFASGGKLFTAQPILTPCAFPLFNTIDLNGNPLDMTKKDFLRCPINLFLVSQKAPFARGMINSWKKPWLKEFPQLDSWELILVSNYMLSLIHI